MLDLDAFTSAISTNPSLVSIMWANNETGVIFPIEELCQMSRELGATFHTDASQVVGKLPIDVSAMPIDFLTLTGHKFGAPKGIGALYISRNSSLPPLVNGGHQELGLRGGTEAVALIAGINKASILAYKSSRQFDSHVRPLRDRLESSILDHISDSQVNGDQSPRLANTTNISFRGIASEALLLLLDQAGICASSGSACMALSDEASYVINAMVGIERARSAVRFSMGLSTTDEEIDRTIDVVTKIVLRIRGS
jgi:cysteine desulfurase